MDMLMDISLVIQCISLMEIIPATEMDIDIVDYILDISQWTYRNYDFRCDEYEPKLPSSQD